MYFFSSIGYNWLFLNAILFLYEGNFGFFKYFRFVQELLLFDFKAVFHPPCFFDHVSNSIAFFQQAILLVICYNVPKLFYSKLSHVSVGKYNFGHLELFNNSRLFFLLLFYDAIFDFYLLLHFLFVFFEFGNESVIITYKFFTSGKEYKI